MKQNQLPEVWLRGLLPGIPPLLQPVAHALLQAREEVKDYIAGFPSELLWEKPSGVASVGFHLMHLSGVLNRLFTYARGEGLSAEQLYHLSQEGKPTEETSVEELLGKFETQVEQALIQLKATDEESLLEHRGVGRAQLPSTTLGLLFHAAEHTQRHVGQLLVTAKILQAQTKI